MTRNLTPRAVLMGLVLGLSISAVVYYNDAVIRQWLLVFHLLPIAVLGPLLLLTLAFNPLLGLLKRRRLGAGELAVMTAIALASGSLPDAGFWRTFATIVAMPAQLEKTRPHWINAEVLSYVPDGPAALAPGHVRDWRELARRIVAGPAQDATAEALWQAMTPVQRTLVQDAADAATLDLDAVQRLRRLVNEALAAAAPTLAADRARDVAAMPEAQRTQLARAALADAWPDLVLAAPRGGGVLLADGHRDPAVLDPLLNGVDDATGSVWSSVRWSAWWPVIAVWGGAALLLAVASVCLAVIVHPQWAHRELLAYPIPRFIQEMLETDPGQSLPNAFRQRLFWIGVAVTFAIGLINGLHEWFADFPQINLWLSFIPLTELFPTASRMRESLAFFHPIIFPLVVAFAWFLPANVSFSLGVAPLLYVLLGTALLSRGQVLSNEYLGAGNANLLRFGAYVGMALIILYTGRRWYAQAALGAMGWPASTAPPAVVWAARGLALSTFAAIGVLCAAGLDWPLAIVCVPLILLTFLVIARVAAETGMFYIQAWWLPVGVVTALLGFESLGPTGYLMLALTSIVLIGDTRCVLIGNLVHALKISDDAAGAPPRRLVPWLMVMIVASFAVGGAATLYFQHRHGVSSMDNWSRELLPAMPFDHLAQEANAAAARGRLFEAARLNGLDRLAAATPDAGAWGWAFAGFALLLAVSFARLRLAWWPLHPVVFLVWGTFPSNRYAFSILLGWAIKQAVVKTAGARGYKNGIPLMIGLIAGTLLVATMWMIVGACYHWATGRSPAFYAFT